MLSPFLARVHGYYHFTIQKESNNNKACFRIYKENVEVLYNNAKGGTDSTPVGATSFILELQAGEKVQIINDDSTSIKGMHTDPPAGFLLYGL